jgi:hypothetical protein
VLFRSVFRVLIGVELLQAAPALAVDLTVKSSLSESLDVNTNYFLVPQPKGTTYTPTSSINFDVAARTPTSRYMFNGDFSYSSYLGPGAEDAPLRRVMQNGFTAGVEYAGKVTGDKLALSGWWRRQDVASAQLSDIGTATAGGEVSSYGIGGNVNRQLTSTDSLALSATGTSSSFTSSSASSFFNLATGATWSHRIDPTKELIASADLNWTIRDDQAQSDTKFWKAVTGVHMRPTPRLSLSGSVGVGLVHSQGAPAVAAPLDPFATFDSAGMAVARLWDVQAAYKLWSLTELSVSASQSITPGVLGDLSQRMTFGIGLTHSINSISSVLFNGQVTQFNAGSGQSGSNASDFWTASASYTRRLTREWRTQLTYSYRRRDSDANSVTSNSFVMVLARDMTLLP